MAILATSASADTVSLSLCDAAVTGSCQPPTLAFGQKVRVEARAAYVVAGPVPFLAIASRTLTVFHEMTVQKYP